MRLEKTAALLFGSKIVRSVAGFIATLYIARTLGSEALGVYSIALAVTFWSVIPTRAISVAIKKRVSERVNSAGVLSAGFLFNGGISIILAFIYWLLQPWMNQYIGKPVGGLVVLLILGNALFSTVTAAIQGQNLVARAGLIQMVEQALRTGFQISLITLGYQVYGIFFGHFFSLSISILFGVTLLQLNIKTPTRRDFEELLSYAQYSWLGTLRGRVFGMLDTLTLAFFVSASLIGIYQAAWNIASIFIMASLSIQQTMFPEISALAAKNDHERIRDYLYESLIFIAVLAIPGFFGSLIIGGDILRIYGSEFKKGGPVLAILILARTAFAFGSQFINILNALDRPDLAFRISLIFIMANAILNAVLIPLIGWYGAAFATATSTFIVVGLSYRVLNNLIGPLAIPYYELGVEVFVAAGMSVVIYVMSLILQKEIHSTILIILVGATIYLFGILALSGRIRKKIIILVPKSVRPRFK